MNSSVRVVIFFCIILTLFCSEALAENNKAILIGISQYADPDIAQLRYADEDVKTFNLILANFSSYKPSDIILLTNREASKASIQNALLNAVKSSQKHPIDHFIFMFAGHGVPRTILSRQTSSFLAPHDAVFSQFYADVGGTSSNDTFISRAWLVKQLSSIKAKSIVVILDSCYSGVTDFGKLFVENLGFGFSYIETVNSKRGVVIVQKKGQSESGEKRIAFLASSREDQPSAEYEELKQGALSYCIFKYLNEVRRETLSTEIKEITINAVYSEILSLFNTVYVRGMPLSSVHQPLLFPIPDFDVVRDMRFVSLQGGMRPKIKKGTIDIMTDPEKAEVYVDGVKTGELTNCTLELTEGQHMISLYLPKTNYYHSFIVYIREGYHERAYEFLRGNLEVESYAERRGEMAPILDIYLDGQYMGKTRLKLDNLVAGTHVLRVHVEGEIKETSIEIRPASPLVVRYKIIRGKVPIKEERTGVSDVTF